MLSNCWTDRVTMLKNKCARFYTIDSFYLRQAYPPPLLHLISQNNVSGISSKGGHQL